LEKLRILIVHFLDARRDAIKSGLLGKRARSCSLGGGKPLREVVVIDEAIE
jgi:hypothetical protein